MFADNQNSFLLASKEHNKEWSYRYDPLSLTFKSDVKSVFDNNKVREIKADSDVKMVNSMFWPIFMGYHDFLF